MVTADPSTPQLPAEARARVDIDRQLVEAGWVIQSYGSHTVAAARGVAVREVTLEKGHGRADYLLFVGEAPLALTVTPRPGLAEQLTTRLPRDRKGRSLGQFDLEQRLMRYPCSYMIYSPAFDGLPTAVKDAVYRRMFAILDARDAGARYAHLSAPVRVAIAEILGDTKSDLPADLRQATRP